MKATIKQIVQWEKVYDLRYKREQNPKKKWDLIARSFPTNATTIVLEPFSFLIPTDPLGVLNEKCKRSWLTVLEHLLESVRMEKAGYGWLSGIGGGVEHTQKSMEKLFKKYLQRELKARYGLIRFRELFNYALIAASSTSRKKMAPTEIGELTTLFKDFVPCS